MELWQFSSGLFLLSSSSGFCISLVRTLSSAILSHGYLLHLILKIIPSIDDRCVFVFRRDRHLGYSFCFIQSQANHNLVAAYPLQQHHVSNSSIAAKGHRNGTYLSPPTILIIPPIPQLPLNARLRSRAPGLLVHLEPRRCRQPRLRDRPVGKVDVLRLGYQSFCIPRDTLTEVERALGVRLPPQDLRQ